MRVRQKLEALPMLTFALFIKPNSCTKFDIGTSDMTQYVVWPLAGRMSVISLHTNILPFDYNAISV